MTPLRYAAIAVLDWIDAHLLRHSLHRWGLCDWIAWHPWWGPERWEAEAQAWIDLMDNAKRKRGG